MFVVDLIKYLLLKKFLISRDRFPTNFDYVEPRGYWFFYICTFECQGKPSSAAAKGHSFSNSDLKYLENFNNPYVKIILACKVCNKEQSMKFQNTWKRHFLTHSSDEDKPHKCEICGKATVTAQQMKSHMNTHSKKMKTDVKFHPYEIWYIWNGTLLFWLHGCRVCW